MIKYSIFILLLLSSLFTFGQTRPDSIVVTIGLSATEIERKGGIAYNKENDNVWRAYYKNGVLHSEGEYRKRLGIVGCHFIFYHIKHGTFKYYSKEGELKKIEYYKKDKLFKEEILDSAYFNSNVPNELVE